MLLQRLVKDDTSGFNYDYMGYAEYEFGATRNGRTALAKSFLDGNLHARVINFSQDGDLKQIEVVAAGDKDLIDRIVQDGGRVRMTKCGFRIDDDNIVGWMNVAWESYRATPLLLVRKSLGGEEIHTRIEKFLKPAIEALKEVDA